jgi:abortive infection alpha-like protein
VADGRADANADRPVRRTWPGRGNPNSRGVARGDAQQSAQVVAAAGNAIVTAARVGRLLGRSGWRIARQLPGAEVVEAQAQKLRQVAGAEMLRLLEAPQNGRGAGTSEEQRAVLLVHDSGGDAEPLRSAMTELLQRSTDPDREKSRDYLYGNIVSQLVPDEARILATLAAGNVYAVIDVVAKQIGRSSTRTVLADVSTVGTAAGISNPANTPTYLGRLRRFGLLETSTAGAESAELADQFDVAEQDPAVLAARADVDHGKLGSSRLVRKSVSLTPFGREFWAACAPPRSALERPPG